MNPRNLRQHIQDGVNLTITGGAELIHKIFLQV